MQPTCKADRMPIVLCLWLQPTAPLLVAPGFIRPCIFNIGEYLRDFFVRKDVLKGGHVARVAGDDGHHSFLCNQKEFAIRMMPSMPFCIMRRRRHAATRL